VAPGRVLVCSANHPALCQFESDPEKFPGVYSVPINAVDKQNPDRSISTKIRVVTDLRGPNATGDPRNHPPALSPFHREVARAVLWWKHKLPGVPVFLMKQDVDAAFKRVWLRILDMGRNATDLPFPKVLDAPTDYEDAAALTRPQGERAGKEKEEVAANGQTTRPPRSEGASPLSERENEGDSDQEEPFPGDGKYLVDDANVCLVSLTCLFGGTGAPGEWMVNAYAGKQYHERGYPAEPIWHTPFCFHSSYLMDDEILMEPLAGVRAWMSRRRARWAPQELMG